MKALLKTGEWIEIETKYLFNNQYNTANGRIFDAQILRIIDDARIDMGKCKYCGAIVKRGEEHMHFEEQESKGCESCFYYRDKLINEDKQTPVVKTVTDTNGITTTRKIVTTVSQYEKTCAYSYGECNNKECRKRGIEWFTPENTFFLKYPNGFNTAPITKEELEERGFTAFNRFNDVATYNKKIGTYTLDVRLKCVDGEITEIKEYYIRNCRNRYFFRFEDGKFFIYNHSFGWKQSPLKNIPASVIKEVKKICSSI